MIFAMVFWPLYLVMLTFLIRYCTQDARRRGKSPLLVCFLVLFFFLVALLFLPMGLLISPLGLVVWLLFRPVDGPSSPKQFRLEDHRVQ